MVHDSVWDDSDYKENKNPNSDCVTNIQQSFEKWSNMTPERKISILSKLFIKFFNNFL